MVQQRPGITGKPVRLAEPPPLLAGREDLLAELDARLAGGDGSRPRTVALTGVGGTGKTSVALEYAHRHLAEVGAAWQLAAEGPTVLASGFGELAAQLGARDVLDTRDSVASVHGMLAAFPAGWLLVFDNAPDRASVEGFLPPAGAGRVLITSRNALWPPGQAVEVPVLDLEVAAGFLAARTGDADHEAAAALAEAVGGLPLALEQAAAYIRATGDTLARYLESFRQHRPEMLVRGAAAGYSSTVATTWSLAFGHLCQSAPAASGLLRLLACCAPEAIPLRLLLQPRPGPAGRFGGEVAALTRLLEDPLAAGDAIAALRRYSLATPAADGSVLVHRLVQNVMLDQMPADLAGHWRQAAAALIEAALPEDPRQPDTWRVFAALLPHAQAALAADSDGLTRIASYLGLSGNYLAAREFSRGLLDERVRMLGAEDPRTLMTRHDLALSTGDAGNAAGARDQFAALLPDQERVLGPEHPDTLTTRHALAFWTGKAGDMAGARDQLATLLPDEERVLGPEHPDTLTTRIHLAWSAQEMGDAAGARDQFAAVLPITKRLLGPEHPRTLMTRHDVAWSTGEAGDWARARDQLAALLPDVERVLGPEHPRTLAARYDLARCTGKAGDAAGARSQLAALLPDEERVLGPEHPDTLATRRNFAHWTIKANGDAEDGAK